MLKLADSLLIMQLPCNESGLVVSPRMSNEGKGLICMPADPTTPGCMSACQQNWVLLGGMG